MKNLLFPGLSSLIPEMHWQKFIWAFVIFLAVLVVLYSETFLSIVSIWWRSETFAHGMFIIPFVGYMIWTQRAILAELKPAPSWWGVPVMAVAIVLWLLGNIIDALVTQQLAVLVMLWSLFIGVFGLLVIRTILFPIAFMFFLIPVGESLIPVLMNITATFTVKALVLSGFPVFREGNYFTIPSGSFEVAKACSGIRYLFATVALGSLFAYLNYHSTRKRVIFILIAIILPIIANGFRAYGIVLIAHYSDMKYAVGVDHFIYGWVFFGLVIFLLFYIGSRYRDDSNHQNKVLLPISSNGVAKTITIYVSLFVIALIGVMGNVFLRSDEDKFSSVSVQNLSVPELIGVWKKNETRATTWFPEFVGASHAVKTSYVNDLELIQLYVAYYVRESQNAELINQANKLYNEKKWKLVNEGQLQLNYNSESLIVNQLILKSGRRYRKLVYWYDVNGYTTTNIYLGKLNQALSRVLGNDRGGAIVAIVTDVNEDDLDGDNKIRSALKYFHAEVQTSLKEIREINSEY